jgi:hypothetical protein
MWIAFCLSMLQDAALNSTPREVPHRDLFGVCLDDAGDLDGDGVHDLWIGDPSILSDRDKTGGCVWAVSGKTGKRLLRITSPTMVWGFGWTLSALADVDGDGKRDVVVGCTFAPSEKTPKPGLEPEPKSPMGESQVSVFSGATGATRFSIKGPADRLKNAWDTAGAGPSLASVGDWNGDGAGDFAIGWTFADEPSLDCGRVDVVSGKDGATLISWSGTEVGDRLGYVVAALDDLDGDGKRELAAGAIPVDPERASYVRVFSSRGSVRASLTSREWAHEGLLSIAPFSDIDGDGVGDLVIGRPFRGPNEVTFFSGKTSREIRRIEPPDVNAWKLGWDLRSVTPPRITVEAGFGARLLCVPDRNGDGVADVFVTMPYAFFHAPAGIVSSADGRPLVSFPVDFQITGDWSHVGLAAAHVGDVDGDGTEDIAIGGASIRYDNCEGVVLLLSGKDLKRVRAIQRRDMTD